MWDPGTVQETKAEDRDALSEVMEQIISGRCSLVLWNLDL